MTNVEKALELVDSGMTLGLGSGRAAKRFVVALGERVRAGLKVQAVPTSRATADLASRAGIPLVKLEDAIPIDVAIDGADEVDPHLNLIKGYGHAHFREKVVASSSKKLVILIGPENAREKVVGTLGQRGRLPVEVVPFALPLVGHRLDELGLTGNLLTDSAGASVTENGNYILDLRVGPITDPAALEEQLRAIPGVVATGLFLGMADVVFIEENGAVETRERPSGG